MSQVNIYALCDSRVVDPVARVQYVGQTRIDVTQRLRRHWVTALAGAKEQRAIWMRSVRAGGGDVLIELLECVPSTEADAAEARQVAHFRALGCDLMNRTDGGPGRRGSTVSPETRQKMRASASRRTVSLETRLKMSAAIKASVAHREHRKRLHQLNQGSKQSFETRARISRSLRGEKNCHAVVTWKAVAAMRERWAAGVRQSQLAREFRCSPATVHAIVHQHRWVES